MMTVYNFLSYVLVIEKKHSLSVSRMIKCPIVFKLVTIYRVKAMVLNATFNNIFSYIVAVSFIGGKTGLPEQNPRPVASN